MLDLLKDRMIQMLFRIMLFPVMTVIFNFSRSVLDNVRVVDMSFSGGKLYFLLDTGEFYYLDGSTKRLITTFREKPDSVQVIVKGNSTAH